MFESIKGRFVGAMGPAAGYISGRFKEMKFVEFAALSCLTLGLVMIGHSIISSWRYSIAVESYNVKLQELQVKIDAIDHNLAVRDGIIQEKDLKIEDLNKSIRLVDHVYEGLAKEAERDEAQVRSARKNYRGVRSGVVVASRDDADRARRLAELYPD